MLNLIGWVVMLSFVIFLDLRLMYVLIMLLVIMLLVLRKLWLLLRVLSVIFSEFVIVGILVVFFGGRLYKFLFIELLGWILFLILLIFVISIVVNVRYGLVVGLGKCILIWCVLLLVMWGIWIDVEWLCVEYVSIIGVLNLGIRCLYELVEVLVNVLIVCVCLMILLM